MIELRDMDILPLDTQQEERHENFIRLRTPPANSSIQRSTTKQQHGIGNENENEIDLMVNSSSQQESKVSSIITEEKEYESSEDTTNFDLSTIFDFIELNKERLGIISYSVSQATLEQIFIQLAKEQHISSSGSSNMH